MRFRLATLHKAQLFQMEKFYTGPNTLLRQLTFRSKILLLTVLFSSAFTKSFAGNSCAAATAITPGGACDNSTVNGTAGAPAATCGGTIAREEWWSFSAVSGSSYSVTYTTTSSDNPVIVIYQPGTCGSLTQFSCTNATGNGTGVVETTTFAATSTGTWYVRILNTNSGTMDGILCMTGPPPANNEPNTATSITVGAVGSTCSYTAGTTLNATSSTCGTIPAPGCGNYSGGDVWYSCVVPSSGALYITTTAGGVTDGEMALYTGTPCGVLTLVECDDDDGPGAMPELVATGLTVGSTVYIRFWEGGNDNNGTFNICVTNPCTAAPDNDECAAATLLTVYGMACTQTAGSINCASPSSQANTCGATADDDDVWYRFVAPTTSIDVTISSITGTTTDLYHSIFSGTCAGGLTAVTCSDPDNSVPTGLTIGQTYYIRVYSASTTTKHFTTFNICLTEMSPCGNPTNNDWCSDPALLTKSASATFTSATASTYTADDPAGQLDPEFCGTLQNNSYYQFVAAATTEVFNITSVSGCASNGIQAEVYEVTHDASGCCTDFNSVSNCFNPGSVSTGTVTATGLTIGSTYVLMIDGYFGANCNFVISGWSATGVLPVDLLYFTGENIGDGNELKWKTATETNNNYFLVERSYDGVNFGTIASINGHGTTSVEHTYSYYDATADDKDTYYRLKQVDFDGHYEYHNTIIVYHKDNSNVQVFPNPATDNISVDIYVENEGIYKIRIIDVVGGYSDQVVSAEKGVNHFLSEQFSKLSKGVYIVQVLTQNDAVMKNIKIVKQ